MKKVFGGIVAVFLLAATAFAGQLGERFPFFPSLVDTKASGEIPIDLFYKPNECRGCHGDIYNQWRGSMHSLARVDPIFLALWEKAYKEAPESTANLCSGCHAAPGVVSRSIKFNPKSGFENPRLVDYGVQCHLCHSISGSSKTATPTGMPENCSIILDPTNTMRGPFENGVSLWHKTEFSEHFTKSEFCGNCHNLFHPASNFPLENTYSEWKSSIYAEKGITCQDCHMMPVDKALEAAATLVRPKNPGYASPVGPKRENIFSHEFTGANFAVQSLLGFPDKAENTRRLLKGAARLQLAALGETAAGKPLTLKAIVSNIAGGHNLPTSLTEIRQMWLEVSVTDSSGEQVFASGIATGGEELPDDAIRFGSRAVDAKGLKTDLPWEVVKFSFNTTIPPKGDAVAKFEFTPPQISKWPLKATVRLRYRSISPVLALALLGKAAPVIDIVDMAKETLAIESR